MKKNLSLTPIKYRGLCKQLSPVTKKRKLELNEPNNWFKKNRKNNVISKENDSKLTKVIEETIQYYENLLNKETSMNLMNLVIKKESESSQNWIVYVKYKKIILDVIHMTKHNAECHGLKTHLLANNIKTEESQRRTIGSKDRPQSPPMKDWKGVFDKIVLEYETFKENSAIPKGILFIDYKRRKIQFHFSNLSNHKTNQWPRIASLDRLNYI